jgi:hypothetical protein
MQGMLITDLVHATFFCQQVVHIEPAKDMNWNLFHLLHNDHPHWNMAGKNIRLIIKGNVNAWSWKGINFFNIVQGLSMNYVSLCFK